ncbi:hypothetical protein CEQ90_08490 [Lewinellaceae bacterium SD302]|nr:hypothetical protein CEQ90_08490 [Lewinellaceae bacterium SD302]
MICMPPFFQFSKLYFRLALGLLLSVPAIILAQSSADSIYVEEVLLIGHKRTKPGVIYREMGFGRGDYIAIKDLEEKVAETRANLMNTGLFVDAKIKYEDWQSPGNRVTFRVEMKETWYIYPVPIFRLADRNFNVWWRDQNRDLDRVNIGAKFTHYNFSGRRDKLRATFQYGYTRKYGGSYRYPYLGKKKNFGVGLGFGISSQREQNYQTVDNQQLFYEDRDNFVYRSWNAFGSLSYRRKLFLTQRLRLEVRRDRVVDSIAILNPFFFREGRRSQRYFKLEYEWTNDRRDIRKYPWDGSYLRFRFTKEGLGIFKERDGMTLRGDYRKFTPLGKKTSLNTSIAVKYSPIRSRQPFLENRAIGFGSDGLVGYQFYVVDGLDMLILRTGLRRELIRSKLTLPKIVFLDAFRSIPFRILVSTQIDQGWAGGPYNEGRNPLANKWLVGGSAGLDLVLYYDMVFGLQYHRNQLGEDVFLLKLDFSL